jgi:hypothetical protein
MKVFILTDSENVCYEYNNVPNKLAKAIKTIMDECADEETDIISSVSTKQHD